MKTETGIASYHHQSGLDWESFVLSHLIKWHLSKGCNPHKTYSEEVIVGSKYVEDRSQTDSYDQDSIEVFDMLSSQRGICTKPHKSIIYFRFTKGYCLGPSHQEAQNRRKGVHRRIIKILPELSRRKPGPYAL